MTNVVVLTGRVVADAELFYTQSGSTICNFTIANNKKYKEIEQSTFIEVSLFGAFAEAMYTYLKKGTLLNVVGELTQESWEKDGKNYYKYKIKGKEIDLISSPKSEQSKKE